MKTQSRGTHREAHNSTGLTMNNDMLNFLTGRQLIIYKGRCRSIHVQNFIILLSKSDFKIQTMTVCFQLPFEVATYWIQHTLLIIVPFFLVSCQGMSYQLLLRWILGTSRGAVKPPKFNKLRHFIMLTWPQNAGNPIFADRNLNVFWGKRALEGPLV